MIFNKKISGKYVNLRYVSIADAEFVLQLRTDDRYNKYLHETQNDRNLQIEWIENQQKRSGDYYFVVYNEHDEKIGLISLYNMTKNTAEFGRWISKGNAVESLEAAVLIHDFGFNKFNLNEIYTCTMKENKKVVNFWNRFGGKFGGYIEEDNFILYKNIVGKEDYYSNIYPEISKLLRY